MRRFVKTFTVRRHAQFTVVQDGEKGVFEVLRWGASNLEPMQIGRAFPYQHERRSLEQARSEAIGFARRLAAEAEQALAVEGEPLAPRSEAEAEALDAKAAAAAQRLSPSEQEAARRR